MQKEKRSVRGMTDAIFKSVFEDIDLLTAYINQICKSNIDSKNMEYEPNEIKQMPKRKGVRFDVRTKGTTEEGFYHFDLEAQQVRPEIDVFRRRKIHYASVMYASAYEEGSKYERESYIREIFLIKHSSDFYGKPIKRTILRNVDDKEDYKDIEIIEIYMEEIYSMDVEKLDEYGKIIREMIGVFLTDDVEEYTKSKIEATRKVAKRIMSYSQKDLDRLEKEWEKYNEIMYDYELNEAKKEARAEGLAEGRAEAYRNILSSGVSLESLAKMLNISIEDLKSIVKDR